MEPQAIGWTITGIVGICCGGFLLRVQTKIDRFENKADKKYVDKDVFKAVQEKLAVEVGVLMDGQKDMKKDT